MWCGLSVGGMVALRAALTFPQRVRRLILLDTDAGAETAKKTNKECCSPIILERLVALSIAWPGLRLAWPAGDAPMFRARGTDAT